MLLRSNEVHVSLAMVAHGPFLSCLGLAALLQHRVQSNFEHSMVECWIVSGGGGWGVERVEELYGNQSGGGITIQSRVEGQHGMFREICKEVCAIYSCWNGDMDRAQVDVGFVVEDWEGAGFCWVGEGVNGNHFFQLVAGMSSMPVVWSKWRGWEKR